MNTKNYIYIICTLCVFIFVTQLNVCLAKGYTDGVLLEDRTTGMEYKKLLTEGRNNDQDYDVELTSINDNQEDIFVIEDSDNDDQQRYSKKNSAKKRGKSFSQMVLDLHNK